MNSHASVYAAVEHAYQQIKLTGITITMWSLAVGISLVIITFEIINRYKSTLDQRNGQPDMKAFMDLLWPLMIYTVIILGAPFIISTVEKTFSLMESSLMKKLGYEKRINEEALSNELLSLIDTENRPGSMSISVTLDWLSVAVFKPFLFALEHWIFGIALAGRFLYLLLLELIAPLAIVSLLSSKTSHWFYSWGKNMLVCYLLVPAFLIANQLGEACKQFLIAGDPCSLLALAGSVLIKLYLFKVASTKVFNLLT